MHGLEVIKIDEKSTEGNTGAAGSGAGGIVKVLVILAVAVVATAAVVYYAAGLTYQSSINDKEAKIVLAQEKVDELEATIAGLEECPAAGGAATTKLACDTCHDLDQTKSFHSVTQVKLLSEARGQTPRICTTCHGSQPHNVHQKKLSTGEMICDTCHVSSEGDYIVPQVPEGKTLVCEACHASSGEEADVGNYVSIHVVEGKKECEICHMGDPVKVHKKATEKLGTVG